MRRMILSIGFVTLLSLGCRSETAKSPDGAGPSALGGGERSERIRGRRSRGRRLARSGVRPFFQRLVCRARG